MALLIPESPIYLIRKDKIGAALNSEKRLNIAKVDSHRALEQLRLVVLLEQQQAHTDEPKYIDCLQHTNRRRTLIVAFANILPQLFGLTLLSDASYFMQIVGMNANNSIVFLVLGIGLGLIANIVSIWILTAVGRRPLMVTTLAITGMSIAGYFAGTVPIWWAAVSMMLIVIVCGIGLWPASFAVSAETSSLRLRAKTQGLGWFVGGLSTGGWGIILPYVYNPDAGNLRAKTGFMYAAFCALGLAVSWMVVPEMKGRTAVDIDRMFELNLPSRQFKRWPSDIDTSGVERAQSYSSDVP